ncbi:MAG: response regulator transcription factor [Hyphomicrobiales bacterium]|nr:response regulator transcription factor [Hyphomicrobiales bacterium]
MTEHHIAIVDDHPLFRNALRHTLSDAFVNLKLSEAGSLDELVALLTEHAVDLILLDLNMPGVAGFSGLVTLRSLYPDTPVVVVSANEAPSAIRRCLNLGASGYIPKTVSVDKIRTAIAEVLGGEIWVPSDIDFTVEDDPEIATLANRIATLTPQQMRVLTLLGEGLLNKQIAYNLGVSEATVKAHVSAVLQKLGVESRTQAVIAVQRIEDEIGEYRKNVSGEAV